MKKFAIGEECKYYDIIIVEAETFDEAVNKISKEYEELVGIGSDVHNYIDITDVVVEKLGFPAFDTLCDTLGDNYNEEEHERKSDIFNTIEWGNLVKGVFYDKD